MPSTAAGLPQPAPPVPATTAPERQPDARSRGQKTRTVTLGTTTARLGNLVTFTSPGGGVGLTTLMAMCGLTLGKRGVGCALMDADLGGGGLGVLLGIEHEQGLSLQDLNAPLGHIEGDALNHELPRWEGMPVLANAPWSGEDPDWWEMQAAVRALCEANEIVLADAGRGVVLEHVPELAEARHIVAVELSALGLARARSHLAMLDRLSSRDDEDDDAQSAGDPGEKEPPIIIGVEPRGASKRAMTSSVALQEAIARFGDEALGPLHGDPATCADIMNGLGVKTVPKVDKRTIESLSDLIVEPAPQPRAARHRRRGARRSRR